MSRIRLVALVCTAPLFWLISCGGDPVTRGGGAQSDPRLDPVGESTEAIHKGQSGAANGQPDYCDDPAQKCVSGEGDCDLNSQCTGASIVCGTKNGPQFGLGTQIDVCVPSTCTNGTQDAGETGTDCGASCGSCLTCPLGPNGSPNGCSFLCPCAATGGDCDADYECQAGLVCKVGAGPLYGQPSGNDVCVLSHCTNTVMDAGESGVDCGGSCGGSCPSSLCPPAGQSNGTSNFCSPTCPCSAKQGDCDQASECTAGLKCSVGKGPQFNFGASTDMCLLAHCSDGTQNSDETGTDCGGADCGLCTTCSGTNGTASFCSACFCGSGQGNCASDAQCRTGLKCGTANGPQFSFSSSTNVCVPPTCTNGIKDGAETGIDCGGSCGGCLGGCGSPNTSNYCSTSCRCPSGGGDCDSNAECQFGLVCATGNGAKFGHAGFDYCVPPHCTDGVQNADETSSDCGGSCGSTGCPAPTPTPTSCTTAIDTCGAAGNESCCVSASVPGGTYNRLNNASFAATVPAFKLDKFEVTVARFRAFVTAYDAWKGAGHPAVGEGAYGPIANSGWQQTTPQGGATTWPLAADAATIRAGLVNTTACPAFAGSSPLWTDSPGANDSKPINCVTWYEAFAFCDWDGGRLPTEAQWNFAAAAGSAQRLYPWGNAPAPDNAHASFACQEDGNSATCSVNDILTPGTASAGIGLYGQADLAGNVWDLVLDAYHNGSLPTPCSDCADLTSADTPWRAMRGGSFASAAPGTNLQNTFRTTFPPATRGQNVGIRCAR